MAGLFCLRSFSVPQVVLEKMAGYALHMVCKMVMLADLAMQSRYLL